MDGAVFQRCMHCGWSLCWSCHSEAVGDPLEEGEDEGGGATLPAEVKLCPHAHEPGLASASTAAGSDGDDEERMQLNDSDMTEMGSLSQMACIRRGSVKECSLCASAFHGYGDACGACRRMGAAGSSRQCSRCACYFQGFGSTCTECLLAPPAGRQQLADP